MTCLASGWMQIRARAKQRRVELPLTISDHADWPQLVETIREVDPSQFVGDSRARGRVSSSRKTARHRCNGFEFAWVR